MQVEFEYNPKAPPPSIPPNELGIGSEEDSLQNVFHLVPKAPTHDYRRYKEVQGVVLRYAARMVAQPGLSGLGPFDADRRCALPSLLSGLTHVLTSGESANSAN